MVHTMNHRPLLSHMSNLFEHGGVVTHVSMSTFLATGQLSPLAWYMTSNFIQQLLLLRYSPSFHFITSQK